MFRPKSSVVADQILVISLDLVPSLGEMPPEHWDHDLADLGSSISIGHLGQS